MKPLPEKFANEGDEVHPPSVSSQTDYYQQMITTKFTLSPPGCTIKYLSSVKDEVLIQFIQRTWGGLLSNMGGCPSWLHSHCPTLWN